MWRSIAGRYGLGGVGVGRPRRWRVRERHRGVRRGGARARGEAIGELVLQWPEMPGRALKLVSRLSGLGTGGRVDNHRRTMRWRRCECGGFFGDAVRGEGARGWRQSTRGYRWDVSRYRVSFVMMSLFAPSEARSQCRLGSGCADGRLIVLPQKSPVANIWRTTLVPLLQPPTRQPHRSTPTATEDGPSAQCTCDLLALAHPVDKIRGRFASRGSCRARVPASIPPDPGSALPASCPKAPSRVLTSRSNPPSHARNKPSRHPLALLLAAFNTWTQARQQSQESRSKPQKRRRYAS